MSKAPISRVWTWVWVEMEEPIFPRTEPSGADIQSVDHDMYASFTVFRPTRYSVAKVSRRMSMRAISIPSLNPSAHYLVATLSLQVLHCSALQYGAVFGAYTGWGFSVPQKI